MATLGQYLGDLRQGKGLTFRDLEEKIGVSNGYLNLLEHNRIKRPSPEVLFKLANFYGVPFPSLMKLAGYPTGVAEPTSANRNQEVTAALLKDLTRNELNRVRNFIGYLRTERRQRK